MIKKTPLLAVVFIALFVAIQPAWACSCAEGSLCNYMSAGMIFVARAVETNQPSEYRLIVEERFKGVPDSTVDIRGYNDPLCSMFIENGQRYLFFGSPLAPGDPFWIHMCSGSARVEQMSTELAYLRDWKSGRTVTTVQGIVLTREESPIADATVRVSNSNQQWTARTNSDGIFRIPNVPPAEYTATAEREGFLSAEAFRPVEIDVRGCGHLPITLHYRTRMSGSVRDASGIPVALVDVDLVRLKDDDDERLESTYVTDTDGRFVFDGFDPGKYVIRLGDGPSADTPYATRYYPAADSLEKAERITITGATELTNLDFRVGNAFPTRLIKVRAIWEDGRPVTNATVECASGSISDPDWDFTDAETDANGRATCRVLSMRSYDVKLLRLHWATMDSPTRLSSPATVPMSDYTAEVELRLPMVNRETDAPLETLAGRRPGKRF